MNDEFEQWRVRLRKRLALVVDYGQPYRVRLCATRAIQGMMDANHPLRRESAEELLERVLRPYDKREFIVERRTVMLPVRRPPQSLLDVWE